MKIIGGRNLKEHKCKDLYANGLAIKYSKRYSFEIKGDNLDWRLFKKMFDNDTFCSYEDYVATVSYCPCCGKRLDEIL